MIDHEGRLVSAYKDTCTNYEPDLDRETNVISVKSGMLYECVNYDFGDNIDQGCFWCINKDYQHQDAALPPKDDKLARVLEKLKQAALPDEETEKEQFWDIVDMCVDNAVDTIRVYDELIKEMIKIIEE